MLPLHSLGKKNWGTQKCGITQSLLKLNKTNCFVNLEKVLVPLPKKAFLLPSPQFSPSYLGGRNPSKSVTYPHTPTPHRTNHFPTVSLYASCTYDNVSSLYFNCVSNICLNKLKHYLDIYNKTRSSLFSLQPLLTIWYVSFQPSFYT